MARCHLKVKNQRRTYAPQISKRLVDRFALMVVEDLNGKGLARPRMDQSVFEASWATLTLTHYPFKLTHYRTLSCS